MMNCNWMVTQANKDRKALIGYGYSKSSVNSMSWKEVTSELQSLGHKFKA